MHVEALVGCIPLSQSGTARPVVVAAFGRKLAELRGEKSGEVVVRQMGKLGVQLTASTLYQYEAGTVKAPDPGVLWALSKIYDVDVGDLIALLVANRGRPELTGERLAQILESQPTVNHATAAAASRLAELHHGIKRIAAELLELGERARTPAFDEEVGEARANPPESRAGGRRRRR